MYSLNKLESYSRISALGPVGHCTSHFKSAVCISCRPPVDVHKGEGGRPMWTHVDRGREVKNRIFCGGHNWMTPYSTENSLQQVPQHYLLAEASPGNEVRGAGHEFFLSSPAQHFSCVPRLF